MCLRYLVASWTCCYCCILREHVSRADESILTSEFVPQKEIGISGWEVQRLNRRFFMRYFTWYFIRLCIRYFTRLSIRYFLIANLMILHESFSIIGRPPWSSQTLLRNPITKKILSVLSCYLRIRCLNSGSCLGHPYDDMIRMAMGAWNRERAAERGRWCTHLTLGVTRKWPPKTGAANWITIGASVSISRRLSCVRPADIGHHLVTKDLALVLARHRVSQFVTCTDRTTFDAKMWLGMKMRPCSKCDRAQNATVSFCPDMFIDLI